MTLTRDRKLSCKVVKFVEGKMQRLLIAIGEHDVQQTFILTPKDP